MANVLINSKRLQSYMEMTATKPSGFKSVAESSVQRALSGGPIRLETAKRIAIELNCHFLDIIDVDW